MSRARCQTCSLHHRPRCKPHPQRWPLGPLVEAVANDTRRGRGRIHDVALCLGVSGESVRSAAEFGLTDEQADRWAIRCGLHPAYVWPGWIDAGLTVRDAQFVASGWRPAWLHDERADRSEVAA